MLRILVVFSLPPKIFQEGGTIYSSTSLWLLLVNAASLGYRRVLECEGGGEL